MSLSYIKSDWWYNAVLKCLHQVYLITHHKYVSVEQVMISISFRAFYTSQRKKRKTWAQLLKDVWIWSSKFIVWKEGLFSLPSAWLTKALSHTHIHSPHTPHPTHTHTAICNISTQLKFLKHAKINSEHRKGNFRWAWKVCLSNLSSLL